MESGDKYNRKSKSLGLLCENFISTYGQVHGDIISLDDASFRLCVPRRRLYDVVNVLESVHIVSRQQKNRWPPLSLNSSRSHTSITKFGPSIGCLVLENISTTFRLPRKHLLKLETHIWTACWARLMGKGIGLTEICKISTLSIVSKQHCTIHEVKTRISWIYTTFEFKSHFHSW